MLFKSGIDFLRFVGDILQLLFCGISGIYVGTWIDENSYNIIVAKLQ